MRDETKALFYLAFGECNFLRDVSRRYSSSKWTKSTEFLEPLISEWNQTISSFQDFSKLAFTTEMLKEEEYYFQSRRLNDFMPTNLEGFKKNSQYIIETKLGDTQYLKKGAKPIDFYKGQAVYHRDQVNQLLNEWGWKRLGRVIKTDELESPCKILEKRKKIKLSSESKLEHDKVTLTESSEEHNIEEELIDPRCKLYEYSQTEEFDPGEIDVETGDIPMNKFGNVEVWSPANIPRGGVHVTFQHAKEACKLLQVKFVPAVVGFEFRGGKSKARFNGVIISEMNESRVREQAQKIEQDILRNKLEMEKKERAFNWKQLLEAHWTILHSTLAFSSSSNS